MRRITTIASCLLILALAAAGAQARPDPSLIHVTGEGEASLVPDTAIVSLTVTREADSAKAALDANSAAMEQVMTAMRKAGIEDRDLQTRDFSIQPRYSRARNDSEQAPRIVGYLVRNSLSVRIRNIQQVGEIMDRAVQLGVNDGGQLLLTNDDPGPALAIARRKAVEDAMSRARTLADAAGVEVGRIISLSEQNRGSQPVPRMKMHADAAMAMSAEAVPVASGENTYRVTVQMTVAIEQ